jgi:hypothetical protein
MQVSLYDNTQWALQYLEAQTPPPLTPPTPPMQISLYDNTQMGVALGRHNVAGGRSGPTAAGTHGCDTTHKWALHYLLEEDSCGFVAGGGRN